MKFSNLLITGLAIFSLSACGASDGEDKQNTSSAHAAQIEKTAAASPAKATASLLASMPSGIYKHDDTHAYITFSYSHFGLSNPQIGFKSFETELKLDANNLAKSTLAVVIDATSIDSRVDEYDEHLNDEKMFDTANNPEITFMTTNVVSTGADTLNVTGDLTIKGVTKSIVFATKINKAGEVRGKNKIGISATSKIKRSDWGLGLYAPAVSDDVVITVEAEMVEAE